MEFRKMVTITRYETAKETLMYRTVLWTLWERERVGRFGRMALKHVFMQAKLLQSCPTLCNPIDGSPPSSSVHGILQARTLEWVAMPSSRGSSQLRDRTHVSCIGRQALYH